MPGNIGPSPSTRCHCFCIQTAPQPTTDVCLWIFSHPSSSLVVVFFKLLFSTYSAQTSEIKSHLWIGEKTTFRKWLLFFPFGSKTAVKVDFNAVSARFCGCTLLHQRSGWKFLGSTWQRCGTHSNAGSRNGFCRSSSLAEWIPFDLSSVAPDCKLQTHCVVTASPFVAWHYLITFVTLWLRRLCVRCYTNQYWKISLCPGPEMYYPYINRVDK